jgi:hypothetical protein
MPSVEAQLPLIQVATLPRLMMRTPERLTLTLPRSMLVRHLVLSICKSRARTDRGCKAQDKCAKNGRLLRVRERYPVSQIFPPDTCQDFPVIVRRELGYQVFEFAA